MKALRAATKPLLTFPITSRAVSCQKFLEVLIRFLQLIEISRMLRWRHKELGRSMPIEETPTDDTVGSGNHRLILHVGAVALGVMVLVGTSPLGSAIFGR
jgi:hypothetical protein